VDDKEKFIEWLRTGGEQEKAAKEDGGYLVPSKMPIPLPGWRAAFWRGLARFYLFIGLYGNYWMTFIKGVYFVDTVEYLQGRVKAERLRK
jgi:hypothetical protein